MKDADSVKNVLRVLSIQGFERCLIVVSAMGKTTNALERVVEFYFNKSDYQQEIAKIKEKHIQIAKGLFDENHHVFSEIKLFFDDIESFLRRNKSPNYNFVYDQVVTCGEMISSKILSVYLSDNEVGNQWLDARDFIKTDTNYREGVVNWEDTEKNISQLDKSKTYVTQGFIGSDENNFTVSLGREGSDPRKFENVELLSNISYEEAIEMAYYGASVIHPKTLQPLKQKSIPFFVKSFINPEKAGTKIGISTENQLLESYILKENQVLMRISTRDFSFIAEDHISFIFRELAKRNIKVSLMQNSAISLALCLEDKFNNIDELEAELEQDFNTEIVENVSLFTIRNARLENLVKLYEGKNVLLEQITKTTVQMIING